MKKSKHIFKEGDGFKSDDLNEMDMVRNGLIQAGYKTWPAKLPSGHYDDRPRYTSIVYKGDSFYLGYSSSQLVRPIPFSIMMQYIEQSINSPWPEKEMWFECTIDQMRHPKWGRFQKDHFSDFNLNKIGAYYSNHGNIRFIRLTGGSMYFIDRVDFEVSDISCYQPKKWIHRIIYKYVKIFKKPERKVLVGKEEPMRAQYEKHFNR